MDLEKCPTCAEFIASSAAFCPLCGARQSLDRAAPRPSEGFFMDLEKCPACAEFIASSAAFCPFCGARQSLDRAAPRPLAAPLPAPHKIFKNDPVVVFGAILLPLIIIIAVIGKLNDPQSRTNIPLAKDLPFKEQLVDLKSQASITGGHTLNLKNLNNYAWKDIDVSLNYGMIDGGYTAHLGQLEPGASASISLSDFADGQARFNPFTTKAANFKIHCSVPGGTGLETGEFISTG
jgi:RNA polymerase subunit RPABC4/transcription elongation factor Spt4